jgi:hypothetical protein
MKNITYLNKAVNNSKVLTPIKFKWNDKGLKQFSNSTEKIDFQIGYMAQDVEKFYPDCIKHVKRKEVLNGTQRRTTEDLITYNRDCVYAYIYAGQLK